MELQMLESEVESNAFIYSYSNMKRVCFPVS